MYVLAPCRSFYFTVVAKLPDERQKVVVSYLQLHPPGNEPKLVEQEHKFFQAFLDFVLTNCFTTLTFDEIKQRYDNLKQTSGQTPEAYIAQWEEYFLRIHYGWFTSASNIYSTLGTKQESHGKTQAFQGLYTLAQGIKNPTVAEQFIQQVASFKQIQNFDRQSVITAMTNAVRLRSMEVTRMGRTSKASAKGLQMTPGDNFAEMLGFNNMEAVSGGSEGRAEAEVNAVQLVDWDTIKVKG